MRRQCSQNSQLMHHSSRGRGRHEGSTIRLLLFLGQQLSRMERWPPVTLALAAGELCIPYDIAGVAASTGLYHCYSLCTAGMVALFLEPEALDFVPPLSQACLLPRKIVEVSRSTNFLLDLSWQKLAYVLVFIGS